MRGRVRALGAVRGWHAAAAVRQRWELRPPCVPHPRPCCLPPPTLRHPGGALDHAFVVDVAMLGDLGGVDLQNLHTGLGRGGMQGRGDVWEMVEGEAGRGRAGVTGRRGVRRCGCCGCMPPPPPPPSLPPPPHQHPRFTHLLVGKRDLDLAVQPARPHECGVEHVGAVGGRHQLHLAQLLKPVQLAQQLHQRALHLGQVGRGQGADVWAQGRVVRRGDAAAAI